MGRVQSSGRGDEVKVRGGPGKGDLHIDVRLLRHDDEQLLLVRMRRHDVNRPGVDGARALALTQAAERMPDGLLLTDTDGRVLTANAAFINLVQLASEEPLRGESLARWLGRPGVDLNVMLATLRQQGSVRLFATACAASRGPRPRSRSRPCRCPNSTRRRWPSWCATWGAASAWPAIR
jgi:PAS domain-containing protein